MNQVQIAWGIFALVGILFIVFVVFAIKQTKETDSWGKQMKDPLRKLKGGVK